MTGPTSMRGCAELRQTLGVYVLGAIDTAERAELDGHLAECPTCRDELAGLAGLPALLGRVSEDQLYATAPPGGPLLDRVLAQVTAERRRTRTRRRALSAAAAAVVAVGLAGGAVGLFRAAAPDAPERPGNPPAAAPAPSISASNPGSRVSGAVALTPKAWGTAVTVQLSGLPNYSQCQLVAVGRDDQRDVAASWKVNYYGDKATFNGSTAIAADDLTGFEVVGDGGKRLLVIPVG
ncbi:MAG: anti-sigma factor [Streptosporangiales bacterium]|nr:anti-sigma factor [Streptosporangiales bacterium]